MHKTLTRHLAGLSCLLVMAGPARATIGAGADASAICDAVARRASLSTGVPLAVLQAISLTETGRKGPGGFRPWPWTVNMEGEGVWFATPEEARSYVYSNFKRGARSFDVGCFQINYKWHAQNFSSLDQMMDPQANADYAARYLAELFTEKGDWTKAAGAYHSRTPALAERYAARFDRILARTLAGGGPGDAATDTAAGVPGLPMPGTAGDAIPDIPELALARLMGLEEPPAPRVNSYPLLQAPRPDDAGGGIEGGNTADTGADTGAGTMLGSLVPISGAASGASLFVAAP